MRNNAQHPHNAQNTHKHTNTSLPALPALSTQPTRTPVLFHTNGNAEKRWQNFLLTNFVRREKKDGKDFTSCQKDDKNLPSFLGFLGFLGLYRLFRGVGIGWAVFGSKRSTGCRDMRG